MQKQVGSWYRASQQPSIYNILTSLCHEGFESTLSLISHNFYSLKFKDLKDWNNYRIVPSNYYIYDAEKFPGDINFDMILCHTKFGQYQRLLPLSKYMGIPFVNLEHTWVMPYWNDKTIHDLSQMRGHINVFICKSQIDAWGMSDANNVIIKHAIDSNIFQNQTPIEKRNKRILSICNDWKNRDIPCGFSQFVRIVNGLPVQIRGDTKGVSTATKTIEELVNEYNSSRIYFNTSQYSPIPMSLLEAASCGMALVSYDNCGISEYFTHGHDCLMSNNEKTLKEYILLLLNDDKLAIELGNNARKTIINNNNVENYIKSWNQVLHNVKLK